MVGVYTNSSATLKDGEMCQIKVEGKDTVARVIFDGNQVENLGILLPDYIKGQPYSVESGKSVTIAVFNGNERGNLEFDISFSDAHIVAASAIGLALGLLATSN